jgi:hypothetical protein
MSESASVRFPLITDDQMHTYTLDLTTNAEWRSSIASLRFDPTSTNDADIFVDEIAFEGDGVAAINVY